MSQIDELRDRLLSAERHFHKVTEQSRGYRERLLGLMSRIEEEIRSRQEMQVQQADEIRRLMGENDQLRSMLFSLLQAVESRDDDLLDGTLSEMDGRIAALIGEGQGAPAVAAAAAVAASTIADVHEDEPIVMPPYDDGAGAEEALHAGAADSVSAELEEAVDEPETDDIAMAMPMMDEPVDAPEDEPAMAMPAMDVAEEEAAPMAEADVVSETMPPPAASEMDADDALNEFLGISPDETAESETTSYAYATGGWTDEEIGDEPAADMPPPEPAVALADDEDTPPVDEEGSIHDLIDRVKTGMSAEEDEESAADEENGGTAAAE